MLKKVREWFRRRPRYPEAWRTACNGLDTQPGGWVVFKSRLTTGDMQRVVKLATLQVPDVGGASEAEVVEATIGFLNEAGEIIGPLVLDWNWVDELGRPMPLITEDPGVMARLDLREFYWLVNQMQVVVGKVREGAVPPVSGGG